MEFFMKAILRSIKPYWLYLIITKHKTIEVAKNFPKSENWGGIVEMYCSKDMQSFKQIPEKDRVWMSKYLGRVACQFVCDEVEEFHEWELTPHGKYADSERERLENFLTASCLSVEKLVCYRENLPYYKPLYGWHISDLKIYDKPRELSEFWAYNEELHKRYDSEEDFCCYNDTNEYGEALTDCGDAYNNILNCYRCWEEWSGWCHHVTRPPQSWCYVEELK